MFVSDRRNDHTVTIDVFLLIKAWHNVMCKKMLDFVNKRAGALVKQQMSFISELMEVSSAHIYSRFLDNWMHFVFLAQQQLQCFSEYGFSEQDLKSQFYTMVLDRIQYEVSAGDLLREREEIES